MLREEAIMVLKNEQPHCGKKALFPEEKKYEAFDMAIKALEQEPVIDKIRAAIEHLHDWAFSREEILRIIDKYKAEGSDKE